MSEIITFQIGSFSNFIGTHYWNIQDAFAEEYGQDGILNNSALYNEREFKGKTIYTPRCLLFDRDGSLGSMSKNGYFHLDTSSDIDTARQYASSNWYGDVSVSQFDPIPKVPFQRALEDSYHLWTSSSNVPMNKGQSNMSIEERQSIDMLKAKQALLDSKKSELKSKNAELDSAAKASRMDTKYSGSYLFDLQKQIGYLEEQVRDLLEDIERRKLLLKKLRKEELTNEELQQLSFDLDANAKYWTDYNKSFWHPHSLHILKDLPYDDPYDFYSRKIVSNDEMEEFIDHLRIQAEDCNNLQGFQLMVDTDNCFGSMGTSFLYEVKDEFAKVPIVALPVLHDTNQRSIGQTPLDVQKVRSLNRAQTLAALYTSCSLIIPVDPTSISRDAFPHLSGLNTNKIFHLSSIIASAFDSATLSYRKVSDGLQLRGFIDGLALSPKTNFSSLHTALPLPLEQNGSLSYLLFGYDIHHLYRSEDKKLDVSKIKKKILPYADFMSPLINYHAVGDWSIRNTLGRSLDGKITLPLAESITLRGVPDWACRHPADPDYDSASLLRSYLKQYGCPSRYFLSTKEAAPIPMSYPRFFSPNLDVRGIIQKGNQNGLVKSMPMMTHLQTTSEMTDLFRVLAKGANPEFARDLAAFEYDVGEVMDAEDKMLTLQEDYTH